MLDKLLENKKKIIALVLALVLTLAGIKLSDQQQATIVDTVSEVLPDASKPATPAAP